MRVFLVIAAMALAAPASAEPPDARASYVERRGMLELDGQCRLFAANIHAALQATAAQARGALLRGGWSIAQVQNLSKPSSPPHRPQLPGSAHALGRGERADRVGRLDQRQRPDVPRLDARLVRAPRA